MGEEAGDGGGGGLGLAIILRNLRRSLQIVKATPQP